MCKYVRNTILNIVKNEDTKLLNKSYFLEIIKTIYETYNQSRPILEFDNKTPQEITPEDVKQLNILKKESN